MKTVIITLCIALLASSSFGQQVAKPVKDNYQELELFKRIKMSLNKKEKLLKDQLEVVNKKIFSSDEVF